MTEVTWWQHHQQQDFLVAQSIKKPPAVQEKLVQSLHQKDPLEKEMATRSSILAWEILWTEEPGGYSPWVQTQLS